MKIRIVLIWGGGRNKKFKSPDAMRMFQDYVGRINRFLPASAEITAGFPEKKPRSIIWVCDRSEKPVSSEELSVKLERSFSQGLAELCLAIGPPDGFQNNELKKADWIWSFGPMTLPHELAAVVASEQLYRALAILKKLPYHEGH